MPRKANLEIFSLSNVGLDLGFLEIGAGHIDPSIINDVLGTMAFSSRGCLVIVTADWTVLHGAYKENALVITASGYTKKAIEGHDIRIRMYSHFVEAYIYYCFLALNISVPGCFTMYLADLSHQTFKEIDIKLKLSSDIYHLMNDISGNEWPSIGYVPLIDVKDWLDQVGYGTKQVATTSIEKTLFSYINLSLANDWFTETVLWLSYCLEGLYDSPVSGIKKSLIDRVSLVLGTPTNKQKKALGKFYDLRSSLFHGRMSICHPMENEILDDAVNSRWESDEIKSIALATCVVVASIQLLVKNKYSHFSFQEQFHGNKIGE